MITVWMLYALAIAGCALVAALALEAVLGGTRLPRRGVWVMALVAALCVPVAVAIRPVAPRVSAPLPMATGVSSRPAVPSGTDAAWSLDTWAMLSWAGASLLLAVIVGAGAWRLRRVRRAGQVVELDGEAVTITRDTGPGALWFGRPRILAPGWIVSIAPERRALLLTHEREHVAAGDPALLAASLGALVLMPWNVALWGIVARLRTALELDCDARVLATGADPRTYGELLLTVAGTRRAPALDAFLAFASSPSPLERRIRAMSNRGHPISGWRRPCFLLLAVAATLVACETRRPEPLAPVSSYTIADGRVEPAATPANDDSVKQALVRKIRGAVAKAAGGEPTDPLVMVHDASGRLVKSFRLAARHANGAPRLDDEIAPERIATVEVIKNGAVLPEESRGGLILITLKGEGAATRSADAAGGTIRRASPSAAYAVVPDVPTVRIVGPTLGATRGADSVASLTSDEVQLVIHDSEGVVLDRRTTSRELAAAKLKLDPARIARVEVIKPGARTGTTSAIHVYLKPGESWSAR